MEPTAMITTAEPRSTPASVSVRELLVELTGRLASAPAIRQPEAEARELLTALLDEPRCWASLRAEASLDSSIRERALEAAARRVLGAPLAYCVGTAAFRHMTLEVDERVLIPRPETEQLVDVALSLVGPTSGGVAVDVGTGSGAIALAL